MGKALQLTARNINSGNPDFMLNTLTVFFHPDIQRRDAERHRIPVHVRQPVLPQLRGQLLAVGELHHARR